MAAISHVALAGRCSVPGRCGKPGSAERAGRLRWLPRHRYQRKTIRVAVSPEKAFAFWEDYENFPRFMSRVREVRALDGRRSRWIASGPGNIAVEWTSEITNLVPNALIEWRSEPGSSIRHDGHVRFEPDDNDRGGTRVSILLCYVPPGGALGRAIATSHTDPDSDMSEDLKRMKWLLETGQPRGAHPSLAG